MPITYECLQKFVERHGKVLFLDTQGKTKVLKSGDLDSFDLVEKANRFFFEDKWYSREEFERVIEASQGQAG